MGQDWQRVSFQTKHFSKGLAYFFEKSPFITYDVSDFNEDDIDDLEKKCLSAFKASTNIDEFMYALDWQHESFYIILI